MKIGIRKISIFLFVVATLLCNILIDGNLNLLYFYTIVFAIPTVFRKKRMIHEVLIFFLPIAIIAILGTIMGGNSISIRTIVPLMKIFLCIVLMIFVREKLTEKKYNYFLNYITALTLVIFVIALIFHDSSLFWTLNDTSNSFSRVRLHLFYSEPSILGQVSAILFIMWFDKFLKRKNKKNLLCLVLFGMCLVFSFSMSGIMFLFLSVGLTILCISITKNRIRKKYINLVVLGILAFAILMITDNPISNRLIAIFDGVDSSFNFRWSRSIVAFFTVMKNTYLVGLGLGNMNNESVYLNLLHMEAKFSNSFLYFFSETGVLGIFYVIWILSKCIKNIKQNSDKFLRLCLFIFIVLFQFAGGYFTDPFIWAIYGLVLSKNNFV